MTLSERLERAKRERLMAAGLLHSENALKPEGEVDVTDGNASFQHDDIKIEVKSAGLHAVGPPVERSPSTDPPVLAGERSGFCPNCQREGRVDMVDLVGHTVHMSCTTCGTMWRARRPLSEAD